MSYPVEYINCRICGNDRPKFLGLRGNLEYMNAPKLAPNQEHMVTNVVKCRKCGFVYTNPLIVILPEIKASFYNEPKEYNASIHDSDPLKVFNRSLDLIEKSVQQKGRLLDIGSGKGEFLAAAKIKGWETFGVELSKKFTNYANTKYGVNVENIEFEKMDFPDNYFDVVTLNMVLEHIDNPHDLMVKINKILKQKGVLYIEVPNMNSWLLKIINLCYKFQGKNWSSLVSPLHHPFHCYGYQSFSLSLLCKMNNFRIKKILILGIGLRGFYHDRDLGTFKIFIRNLLANIFSWINKGDILIAITRKE